MYTCMIAFFLKYQSICTQYKIYEILSYEYYIHLVLYSLYVKTIGLYNYDASEYCVLQSLKSI